jgi:multiple sugar transport system substrate-binding protein
MKMKKSVLVLMVMVLVMSLFLAACGGSNNNTAPNTGKTGNAETGKEAEKEAEKPKEVVELDFWTFWGSETRRPIIEKIVEDFNNSQDGIVVKHTFLPWGDIWTKATAAIAAGDPPDIVVQDINNGPTRAANGQATNLAEFAERDNVQEWFYPELWKTVLYEGDPYAIPFNTDTRFLFYNKDAFRDAGLDPENPPSTWDELEEAAIALDKKSGDRYERIGFYPLWGNFGYDSWLLNAESDGMSYFNYETGEPTIDTPAKAEAIHWINGWTERLGQSTVDSFKAEFGSQQADPFISGKVAMIVTTGTFATQLRDYAGDMDYGVAPVPERVEGNGHWTSGGGFTMEIPKGAKNVEASWEFLKWLGGVEAQVHWAAMNFDNVANIEAAEAAVNHEALDEKGKEVYQFAVDNMKWTKINPMPILAPQYWDLKNPQVDAALLGKKTPEEALAQAQKDVEDLMAREKSKK